MYIFNNNNILLYEGEYSISFNNYYRCGNGKEYRSGKLYFEGEWNKDLPNGKGILYNDDGSVCKEGAWDNGYLREENGYYHWNKQTILEDICGYICFNFIVGLGFLICYPYFDYCMCFLASGLLFITLSIIQQFVNTCMLVLSFFFSFFTMISGFILLDYCEDYCDCMNNPAVYVILHVLSPILGIAYMNKLSKNQYPFFFNILFRFVYKKEWYLYVVNIVLASIMYYIYCISFKSLFDSGFDYCAYFMMITTCIYFITIILQCCKNSIFLFGLVVDFIWGIISIIACIYFIIMILI